MPKNGNISGLVQIGSMDRKITIEQVTETPNAFGERIQSWATFAEVWAAKEDNGGKEEYTAEKETSFGKTVFTIRYLSTINEKMRITLDSKTYDIINIAEIGRRRFQRITTQLRQ